MIAIQLEGVDEYLETSPGTTISVKLENPALGDGDRLSPGSYSLPFDLPGGDASPKNAALLNNPDVIENSEAFAIQNATLLIDGIPFKKGTIKSNSSNGNKIPSHFLFGLSQVSPDFKTTRLRDLIDEEIVIDDAEITKKVHVKRDTAGDLTITANGNTYTYPNTEIGIIDMSVASSSDCFDYTLDKDDAWGPKVVPGSGTTPFGITGIFASVKLVQFYTITPGVYGERDCTDPHIKLHVMTDSEADYRLESNIGDNYYDPFDTFLAGYISGSYPDDKIRFPACFNADPYGEADTKDKEWVNMVTSGTILRNDPNYIMPPLIDISSRVDNPNSLQPYIRVKWIIEKIATHFGFVIEGTFLDHVDVASMLLHNTTLLDLPQNHIGERKFVFWRRSFNLNELVPDITVPEFFAQLQGRYNLAMYFKENTRKVVMNFRETIATSYGFIDITDKASPLTNINDERVTGYTLVVPKEDGDLLSVAESMTIGTSEQMITIRMGAVRNVFSDDVFGTYINGPRVSQKQGTSFGLRVFHYSGIVGGRPLAVIDGTLFLESLATLVTPGIYDALWKYWLHYAKNRRRVELDVAFVLSEILRFDWEAKYRYNRVNYFVKSIDAEVNSAGLRVSKVEMVTVQ